MHDYIEVIRYQPVGLGAAVGTRRLEVILRLQSVQYFGGDRSEMGFTGAARNDKEVRDTGMFTNVQDDHVFGLSVLGQVSAKLGQLFGIHQAPKMNPNRKERKATTFQSDSVVSPETN